MRPAVGERASRPSLALTVLLAVAGVLLSCGQAEQPRSGERPAPLTTEAARSVPPPGPDFTLVDVDGRTFSLAAQRGKVVVIDFLQAGCPTCAAQVPVLTDAATRFGPRGAVVVIVDLSGLDDAGLREYYRGRYNASEEIVIAADPAFRAAEAFRLTSMMGFVVGREGEIRWQGQVYWEALFRAIEDAL